MKVLVFPALLAIAIITTPPKPFAQSSKPVTATVATPSATTLSATHNKLHTTPVAAEASATALDQQTTARR